MAVKLRLTRMGKKKQPFYRIVAADSRVRRDGKYIEKIGHYNPLTHPAEIVINEEKAFYWLKNGALPTDTVKNLFSKKGIMLKWRFMKKGYPQDKIDEEYKKWELLQWERQKREAALAAQAKHKDNQNESVEPATSDNKMEIVESQTEEQVAAPDNEPLQDNE